MSALKRIAGVLALLGAVSTPVGATTLTVNGLNSGAPLIYYTVAGWTIGINNCITSTAGTGGFVNSCANDKVVFTADAYFLSAVFTTIGGGPLASGIGGASSGDITFFMYVTPPTGELISQASAGVTGTAVTSADYLYGSIGTTTPTGNITANLNGSPTLTTAVFTPTAGPAPSGADIRAGSVGNRALGPVTVTSATLTFNAPEPMSIGLLAVGAIGVGLARRRSRRAA